MTIGGRFVLGIYFKNTTTLLHTREKIPYPAFGILAFQNQFPFARYDDDTETNVFLEVVDTSSSLLAFALYGTRSKIQS